MVQEPNFGPQLALSWSSANLRNKEMYPTLEHGAGQMNKYKQIMPVNSSSVWAQLFHYLLQGWSTSGLGAIGSPHSLQPSGQFQITENCGHMLENLLKGISV